MTSYRPPDYDVSLSISLDTFRSVAGTSFEASIAFGEDQQLFSGMLIIPQGNGFPNSSLTADAWLWCEKFSDASPGISVSITLGEPCDPMLMPEEQTELAAFCGMIFNGIITRNWSMEPDFVIGA